MKMNKIRIFSFILLLTIISGCIGVSADVTKANKDLAFGHIDILKKLDIVEEDYDYISFDVTEKVTRAEFAVYFAKMMDYNVPEGNVLYYNDVPKTHYAYNEITYLTSMRLLSGAGDKIFAPDEVMKKEHAYSVLLYALGYQKYMIDGNVIKMAHSAGIADGVSSSDDLLLCDLFIMMYNTLMSETMQVEGYNGYSDTYSKGNTLLYETRDMVYVRNGFLSAADGGNLTGQYASIDDVIIDEKVYKTDIYNISEYLGYKVNFIYQEKKDENKIIWIEPSNNNDVISFEFNEDCYFDKNNWSIEYYVNKREKTLKLAQNIAVIYNGRLVERDISEIFGLAKYDITLIRYNNTEYNYAIVNAYENIMVDSINKTKETVYDFISKSNVNMRAEDYDSFMLMNTNGEEMKLSNVVENSVISIYRSLDNKCFKGIVSYETVSGDVQSIRTEGVVVDGNTYEFYDKNESIDKGIKAVTFYLDHKGYIAYADKRFLGNNQFVAYVYTMYPFDNGFDDGLSIRALNENGKLEKFKTGRDLKIDGKKYIGSEEMLKQFTKMENGKFKPQPMVLAINKDGLVTAVYRASDEGGTSSVLIKSKEIPKIEGKPWYGYARVEQGIIGINALFDDSTKVFNVPADEFVNVANETQFSVSKPAERQNFSGAITYKVTTDDIFYEQYIVRKASTSFSIANAAAFFVVGDLITSVNEEGDNITVLSGMLGGSPAEFELNFDYSMSDEILSAKSGDIYIVAIDGNKIVNHAKVYNNTEGNLELEFYSNTNEPKDYGEAESRYFIGFVKNKKGTAIEVDWENDGTVDQMANLKSGANTIMVCDSNSKEKLYKGSVDDISHGSKIIVNTTYNRNISIVVYK